MLSKPKRWKQFLHKNSWNDRVVPFFNRWRIIATWKVQAEDSPNFTDLELLGCEVAILNWCAPESCPQACHWSSSHANLSDQNSENDLTWCYCSTPSIQRHFNAKSAKCALQSDQRTRLRNRLSTHRVHSFVQQRVLDSGEWFEGLSHQKMVSLVVLHHSWHHRTKDLQYWKKLSNSSPLKAKSSFHNPTGSSARTKTLFKKVIPKPAGRRAELVISPFSFLQIEVGTVSCRTARFLCLPPLPRTSMRACQDVFWHSCSQNKTKEH